MSTSYSNTQGYAEPTPGDPAVANAWGTILNTNLSLIDSSIGGTLSLSVAGSSNVTLTANNGAADQSRNAAFIFTGALTGDISVFWPVSPRGGVFSVYNNTSGAHSLTCSVVGAPGTSVVVPQGGTLVLVSDGTNIRQNMTATGLGIATGTSGHVLGYLDGNNTYSGTSTFTGSITYGGVTLTNAVTGTGKMVLDHSPALVTPNLGIPSAGDLINCTDLPNSSVNGLGTAALVNTGTSGATIPLLNGNNTYSGTANFTSTLQVSADTVATLTATQTMSGKRINRRVVAASATTGTVTPNGDTTDVYKAEGLTGSLVIALPSGTPTDGQTITMRFKDNGTARALDFSAYTAINVTLPTTTVINKWLYVGVEYNSTATTWHMLAVGQQA